MKVLGNLNVCGNQIQGVGGIFDTNGNPIGQNQAPAGMAFKVYEGEFDSTDTFTQDNTENDVYYCIMVINNYVHGVANPIVQLFEAVEDSNGDTNYKSVFADVDIDEENNISFKFVADENYNVAEWSNGTKYYKYRIMGVDASSLDSGSGSGSGSGY